MLRPLVLLAALCIAHATILYAGVNESGGEFGVFAPVDTPGFGLPGRFDVNYAFINKSTVDIFVDQEKINFFRVTFLMERMCPLSFGLGSRFNETVESSLKDAVNYITVTKGVYALLDPHNYMRYNDPSQQPFSGSVIGNSSDPTAATTEQFGEFWAEIARRFQTNPKVVFGINNEPHDMPTELILENNQAAINGIRSVGAEQLILAPGNGFTGGHSWTQVTGNNDAPSSDFMNMLTDPLNNLAIDIHEVLPWAMITEFGGGNNEGCFQMIDEMLNYMKDNDEYIGWSIWAAGPRFSTVWGTSSPCCGADTGSLEPGMLNDEGQPNAFDTVWANAIRPNIPAGMLCRNFAQSNHFLTIFQF
ncbi:hypothetical protein C0992_000352 [Termitomyces sp. T32_za158]|nr:hypothetical protein C0992_000352 [Termitomyces sp. T32_za158]